MILVDLSRIRRGGIIAITIGIIALCLYIINGTVETQSSINIEEIKYKEYSGLNGKFSYSLPSDWKTTPEKFEGGEILYHNNFISQDKKINGYVEVWNLVMSLRDFLNESRKSAADGIAFKNYTIEPVKINGREGFILQYSKLYDKDSYIKAFEVFIMEKDNMFERFAFYIDEKKWKDENKIFFLNIAASGTSK